MNNNTFEDWAATLFAVGIVVFLIWMLIDVILLTRYKGKLKRGIPIWREQLADDIAHFLVTLSTDIKDRYGFIRKEGSMVLVRTRLAGKVLLPYIAIVDLKNDLTQTRIEYRTALTALILAVPFTIIVAPCILPAAIFGHLVSRDAIHRYVRMQIKEHTS